MIVAGDLSFVLLIWVNMWNGSKRHQSLGPCTTRLGEGNGASFDQANAPGGGKLRSAVMIRFVQ